MDDQWFKVNIPVTEVIMSTFIYKVWWQNCTSNTKSPTETLGTGYGINGYISLLFILIWEACMLRSCNHLQPFILAAEKLNCQGRGYVFEPQAPALGCKPHRPMWPHYSTQIWPQPGIEPGPQRERRALHTPASHALLPKCMGTYCHGKFKIWSTGIVVIWHFVKRHSRRVFLVKCLLLNVCNFVFIDQWIIVTQKDRAI